MGGVNRMDCSGHVKEQSKNPFIAHKDQYGRIQTIKEHCENVAVLAKSFAPAQLKEATYQCGLYHDTGKYSREFQQYIRGAFISRVDHSTAGAKLLCTCGTVASILESLCIAGHHTGLPNMGDRTSLSESADFMGRLKRKIPDYQSYQKDLEAPVPVDTVKLSGQPVDDALTVRMLFSCLVDADFLDTEEFMKTSLVKREGFSSIEELRNRFFAQLEDKGFFLPKNPINRKRTEILRQCIQSGENLPGFFSLTVPTGGGKTLSSFAFALEHAVRQGKKRIIYVIPYTSIIEQTVEVLQNFIGSKNIVAHHSHVEYDDESEEMNLHRLATENWDAPVIVTTNVQFLESLFACKTSRCRKLHNIIDSVVIMDEAQMLPVIYLKPVLASLKALVKTFGCSIILCSATQPHLDRFLSVRPRELMKDIPELYAFFRRATFKNEGQKEYSEIAAEIAQRKQALCICLTKSETCEIFGRLKELSEECIYLSTNLCPVHREQVIHEIRQLLREGKPCRVVSTSIISVGVDIDFPEVFLEENGLDSLIQGGGRCNREGRRSAASSIIHIFTTEKSSRSRFMRQERQCTEVVSQNFSDISGVEAIKEYFDRLYEAKDSVLDGRKIENLSQNFEFRRIGEVMKIIEDTTKTLFIPLNDTAKEIEKKLRLGIRTRELMRAAGKFCVNVRSNSSRKMPGLYEQMLADGVAESLDEQLAVLTDLKIYDKKMGLNYVREEGMGFFV